MGWFLEMTLGSRCPLASCLLRGVAVFPPCQLFGLRYPNTGAYKLLDGARFQCQGPKMSASSRRSHSSPLCLPPGFITAEPQLPLPFPGEPARPAGRSGQASVESLLLLCDPVPTGPLCAAYKSGVSVFPSL